MARRFRIATIVGARPQFIKAAPVSALLRKRAREILIHTGQHYDWRMSGSFFRELVIPKPDYNLGVGSGPHGTQTATMILKLEHLLKKLRPDLVLIYGDTNSTLAGALAAAKLSIPIAHVEAGMRSFDRTMPEEVNRVVADHLSSVFFCPSPIAVANLRAEGIRKNVHNVGDNMLDVLFAQLPMSRRSTVLKKLGVQVGMYTLLTLHRAANTDDRKTLSNIITAVETIASPIVFPVHPRTRHALKRYGLIQRLGALPHVHLIDPVGYRDMLSLMRHARLVMTDSGGVQKEAFTLKVPCVTLRNTTEWPETVTLGWNQLVGSNPGKITRAVRNAKRPRVHRYVYGHGKASARIVTALMKLLRSGALTA